MKKTLAIVLAGAFAASISTSALACMAGKMAESKPAPITTALDSQPITPKPETKSDG